MAWIKENDKHNFFLIYFFRYINSNWIVFLFLARAETKQVLSLFDELLQKYKIEAENRNGSALLSDKTEVLYYELGPNIDKTWLYVYCCYRWYFIYRKNCCRFSNTSYLCISCSYAHERIITIVNKDKG